MSKIIALIIHCSEMPQFVFYFLLSILQVKEEVHQGRSKLQHEPVVQVADSPITTKQNAADTLRNSSVRKGKLPTKDLREPDTDNPPLPIPTDHLLINEQQFNVTY